MKRHARKRSFGFSVIELMVTIAIIAILASIALPAYRGYLTNAREMEGKNNLASLKLAEEEYFLENNTYFSGSDTATLISNSNGLWNPVGDEENNGIHNFTYAVTLSGGGYVATATGTGDKVPTTTVLTITKQ